MGKPSLINKFFSFFLRAVVVVTLMVLIALGSFEGVTHYLTGSFYDFRKAKQKESASGTKADVVKEEPEFDDRDMKNTMFFVAGKDGLNHYSALVMMNTRTKAADLLLIPLHAQVTLGGKLQTQIQQRIPNAGSTLELDDIARVYGDDKYRMISDIFSENLALNIAGYDVLTEDQFVALLDLAGTVKYQLADLLSYRNEKQELKYYQAGLQDLKGSDGMILISHLDGTDKQESSRLERSSAYLESWMDKVLGSDDGGKLIDYVEKNAASSLNRSFREEKEIWGSMSPSAVTIRILQGAENKGSFYIDSQKAKLQISTLVKQSAAYDASDDQDSVDSLSDDYEVAASSKDYYIELYNSAFRQGLATEWEGFLEEEGYNISLVDTYQEEGPISTTRIIVNQEGIGQDLLKYFPGADIETGEIETGGDIQVYIGTDSINVGVSDSYAGQESRSDSDDASEDEKEEAEDKDKDKDKDKEEDKKEKSKKKSKSDDKDDDDKEDDKDSKQKDKKKSKDSQAGYYNFDTDSE